MSLLDREDVAEEPADFIERLIRGFDRHGDNEGNEAQIGDLEEALRALVPFLTPDDVDTLKRQHGPMQDLLALPELQPGAADT